jgi:GGDEF domain-containing protein
MLQRVAKLRASCRDTDQSSASGDGFAVLLPDTGLTGARTVATRSTRRAEIEHGKAGLTCSVGVLPTRAMA